MQQQKRTKTKSDTSELPQKKARQRRHKRRGRRSRLRRSLRNVSTLIPLRIISITVFVVIVVVIVSQLILLTDANNQVNSSWASFSRILNVVSSKPGSELTLSDSRRLESGINDLSRSLAALKGRSQLVQPILGLRQDWETSYDLLVVAQSLTAAAHDMLAGTRPVINFMVGGEDDDTVAAQLSSGERIVELLTIGQGRFVSATRHLDSANVSLNDLEVSGVSPDLLLKIEDVRQYYDQLRDINVLLLDTPELLNEVLGLNNTQNYLVLAQNSDELRPSGGYISTYGWITVRNGQVSDYSYSPTTATSPYPPPVSFAERFEIPSWWIQYRDPIYVAWDGSWYADFPSTAELARQYYEAGGNPNTPIDGVIAIDLVGFEYIMEALGSVTVADYNVVITPANFREVIYDIRAVGEGNTPHKRFLSSVYHQIFADWQEIGQDTEANTDMWGAILRALQEKHIMVYFSNDHINEATSSLNWSGEQIDAVGHDYIMVVDANLGNKSNHSVSRQLTYDVELQLDQTLRSRLTVAYNYPSTIAEDDPAVDARYHGPLDYNNLMQVFVPTESILVDINNLPQTPEIVQDDTHTVFISRVNVPYDGSERFQFEYETLPLLGRVGEYAQYRLLLQKQPGMSNETVNVQVSLPPGATLISSSLEPLATYQLEQLVLDFRIDLVTDQWLDIIYQDPPGQE
jgi:hypothetical protein